MAKNGSGYFDFSDSPWFLTVVENTELEACLGHVEQVQCIHRLFSYKCLIDRYIYGSGAQKRS